MSNYSLIRTYDTADGVGIRTAVYFSGCQKALEGKACTGCHNSIAWQQDSGNKWTPEVEQKVIESLKENYIAGLSILGGEPFSEFNLQDVVHLITIVKNTYPEKDIWIWTGYTIEELQSRQNPLIKEILSNIDVMIDGPFIMDLKEPNLIFRGSKNQRILKIKTSTNGVEFEDITKNFMY